VAGPRLRSVGRRTKLATLTTPGILVGLATLSACSVSTPSSTPMPGATMTTAVTAPVFNTTIPLPSCTAPAFAVRLATDRADYSSDESVLISMTVTNVGPRCSGIEAPFANACGVATVTASDAAGTTIWQAGASPSTVFPSCPAIAQQPIPTGWTGSLQVTWSKDICPESGSQCSQQSAPNGTYTILGSYNLTEGGATPKSQPVIVTLSD